MISGRYTIPRWVFSDRIHTFSTPPKSHADHIVFHSNLVFPWFWANFLLKPGKLWIQTHVMMGFSMVFPTVPWSFWDVSAEPLWSEVGLYMHGSTIFLNHQPNDLAPCLQWTCEIQIQWLKSPWNHHEMDPEWRAYFNFTRPYGKW